MNWFWATFFGILIGAASVWTTKPLRPNLKLHQAVILNSVLAALFTALVVRFGVPGEINLFKTATAIHAYEFMAIAVVTAGAVSWFKKT